MKSKMKNHRFWVWLLSLLLVGCKTIHQTTSESLQQTNKAFEETKAKTIVVDSVRLKDSVRVEYKRGKTDTLIIEKWRSAEKTKLVRDTLQVLRTDTIKMYYTNTEYKESKGVPWWQSVVFCIIGGMIIGIIFYKDMIKHNGGGVKGG